MKKFKIKVAGLVIAVTCINDGVAKFCKDYITEEEADFTVTTTAEDIEAERDDVTLSVTDTYLEALAVYRKIAETAPFYDAFLCHGSVIVKDGEAYLFMAKSGTGKTTHSRLWLDNVPSCYILNGDKPILRLKDGRVYACGTPWQGKENYGKNETIPLKSICFLNRGENNEIKEIPPEKALVLFYSGIYKPISEKAAEKTLSVLSEAMEKVKFYSLHCNMDKEAAIISYTGMKDEQNS